MILEHFSFRNIPVKPDAPGFVFAVHTEQQRVCKAIDERLVELENEFIAMATEMQDLIHTLERTKGFFKEWGIRTKMYTLGERISVNRDMRHELVCARIKRTYA